MQFFTDVFLGTYTKLKLKDICPLEEIYDKPKQHIKKQRHYFANKGPSSQSYGFPSSHVWLWELDHKEGWMPNNWCLWIVMWRGLLRVSWMARRSKQSILKEITREYSLEGLMLKLKLPYFGHLMPRTDSLEKTLMLGKIEGRRRRDNRGGNGWMASLTQWHEFEQALGGGEGQGSLACSSPWGCKELDMTEWLNNDKCKIRLSVYTSHSIFYFSFLNLRFSH